MNLIAGNNITLKTLIQCLLVDEDKEAEEIVVKLIEKIEPLKLARVCTCVKDIQKTLLVEPIHVILFDPMLKDMNGQVDFFNSLGADKPHLIIMSHNKVLAADAYEMDAVDFIVKPVIPDRLMRAFTKIIRRDMQLVKEKSSPEEVLFIKDKLRLIKLYIRNILYVEALADYVIIHTDTKKYIVHNTMKKIEAQLPASHFERVHRSFIINLNRISSIEDSSAIIEGQIVPISHSFRAALMDRLNVI